MEVEAIFDNSWEFTTYYQVVYSIFLCGRGAKSFNGSRTGHIVSQGAISGEGDYGKGERLWWLCCFVYFQVLRPIREAAKLEFRTGTLFHCAAVKNEFECRYRCWDSKETV